MVVTSAPISNLSPNLIVESNSVVSWAPVTSMLAGKLVSGFRVDSIWWGLLFSLLLSFFTYILEIFIEPDYKKK